MNRENYGLSFVALAKKDRRLTINTVILSNFKRTDRKDNIRKRNKAQEAISHNGISLGSAGEMMGLLAIKTEKLRLSEDVVLHCLLNLFWNCR